MTDAHAQVRYKTYWQAWAVLLVLTLLMVFVGSRPFLVAGMALKATIIGLWFMHLRFERLGLVLSVTLGIFATGLLLYLLILPDGLAM